MKNTVLILLFSLLPALANAQQAMTPLSGSSPTEGVRLSAPSLTSVDSAAAVQVNPAGLALLPSWSAVLHHTEISRDARLAGGGDVLFAGTPLPLFDFLAVGAGLSWLRPADATGYGDSAKLSLAVAGRYKHLLGLGLSYSHLFSDDDPLVDGIDTLDLGLWLHPLPWVGGALVVRDLNTPEYDGLALQRRYELELTGRPLGNGRLEISAGLALGERRLELDPSFILAGEPLAGLRLFGAVRGVNRDFNRDGQHTWDWRATVGVGVHWERLGLALSTTLATPMDAQPTGPLANNAARSAYQAVGATITVNGHRETPLFTLSRRLLLVDLSGAKGERGLLRLIQQLQEVERRDDLAGVLMKVDDLSMGWSGVQEMRAWLKRLRRAGKKTLAFVIGAGVREYYLAAAAERVLLDPAGGLRLQGLSLRSLYFRGFLDKVGASPQFVRIAEFKSAPEQYTRTGPSPAARRVRRSLADDIYGQLTGDLATDRGKTPADIQALFDQGPFTPPQALASGLVDELIDPQKMDEAVERACGCVMVRADSIRRREEGWRVDDGIAVLLVEGDIVSGKSQRIPLLDIKLVGDRTVIGALEWARGERRVKAVVIRVNSPGGSALASHQIWREVRRLAQRKPVVVSMGDVTASGGYYLAAGGAYILAQPATLTGSIGIFTGKFDLSGLMKILGITTGGEVRGKRALLEAFDRPYTPQERQIILDRLQYYYRQFLGAVARSRGWTQDKVHELARGRVWTGRQAVQNGLADAEGGLTQALAEARKRAGLDPDRPLATFVLPPKKTGLLNRALEAIGLGVAAAAVTGSRTLDDLIPAQARRVLGKLPGVLFRVQSGEPVARMPYEILMP